LFKICKHHLILAFSKAGLPAFLGAATSRRECACAVRVVTNCSKLQHRVEKTYNAQCTAPEAVFNPIFQFLVAVSNIIANLELQTLQILCPALLVLFPQISGKVSVKYLTASATAMELNKSCKWSDLNFGLLLQHRHWHLFT
jgi:hypothetical protein